MNNDRLYIGCIETAEPHMKSKSSLFNSLVWKLAIMFFTANLNVGVPT